MMKHIPFIATVFCLCCSIASTDVAQSAYPSAADELLALIRVNAPLDFCGESVPLHIPEVRERLERELLISLGNRAQVMLWVKRSGRYMPHIEKALRENGMPDDLKYIAVAESALRTHAGSVKGAKGIWQFMEATGVRYQLKVNGDKDERYGFFAATNAALQYLKELYALFGSRTLATAGYNMGESGLKAEMLVQKTGDYYKLYLPLETQQYIFRILSAKLILSNPVRYGFNLTPEDIYAPEPFDRIEIVCPQDAPIQLIAEAAGTHFKAIKDLNPEFRGYYLAQGTHRMLIPSGRADGFQERFKTLFDQWLADREAHIYVVKKGDSLSSLAEKFNVPLQVLLIWNRISVKRPLNPGDRLVIFSDRSP